MEKKERRKRREEEDVVRNRKAAGKSLTGPEFVPLGKRNSPHEETEAPGLSLWHRSPKTLLFKGEPWQGPQTKG